MEVNGIDIRVLFHYRQGIEVWSRKEYPSIHPEGQGTALGFGRATSPRWARRLTVEVLFTTDKLKRAMSANRALQRDWGPDGAKKINLRLQQLAAAPTLEELRMLPGRCHELIGDRAGQLAVELHGGFRLIFRPSANPPPRKGDGGLDWGQVESVTVLEIVDYH